MNMAPVSSSKALFRALLACIVSLALLLGAGCAAKQPLPPANKAPAAGAAPAPSDTPTAAKEPSGQASSAAEGRDAGVQAKTESAVSGQASGQKAGRDQAGPTKSAVARMLESAGRAPDAAQPEKDFALLVPDTVGDGEAFFVAFGGEGAQKATVGWRGKKLSLTEKNPATGRFEAMLPVALDETSKKLPLELDVVWADGRRETFTASLGVSARKYPLQKLRVAPKYARHPPEMDEKVKRDRAELRAAVRKISPVQYWTLPFLRPVPGAVTSLFGARREFNGIKSNPHRGVDFDAEAGDPILALDEGVVVLVSDHYYSGNITVVDHGLGVMSVYLHQSAFNVSVGQHVKRGDVIGFIGSTGRSTGPHLHLSLYVLGESINAAPCIDM